MKGKKHNHRYTMKNLFVTMLLSSLPLLGYAQHQGFVHEASSEYTAPEDKAVVEKLEKWQDLKFGILIHWGLYSVPGIVESWSICSEDVDWISRRTDMTYDEYKRWYWGLKDEFNPVKFNPEAWADAIEKAGMKYAIFTTKHHDGFCMFDSEYTDFTIADGPFASNPKADVLKYVLDAFRSKNLMIGTYFSKPDWHCPYYWDPHYATPNRNVNYKIERHPDTWAKYQEFTRNQIDEITSRYGSVDILWLDGGWVAAPDQDIKMDEIVAMARQNQPGLITVDRTVRGKNENYLTPERSIPEKQLPYPWESCITLTNDWGWVPNAAYKTPAKVVSLLAEIVAKGGSLLLGVGPTAEGVFEDEAVKRMEQIGQWMKVNGEAIYSTVRVADYNDGKVWFTGSKDGKTIYAIQAIDDATGQVPEEISWSVNVPSKGTRITLLQNGKRVKYSVQDGKVVIKLPAGVDRTQPLAFKYKTNK